MDRKTQGGNTMPNKHKIRGAYNEMMGEVKNDRLRKMKGVGEKTYGELKSNVHLPDTDMSEKSMISLAVGLLMIVTGLYFVLRVKDDLC